MEYDFTLKFKLSDSDCDFDQLVDRLGEAGCTDALAGIGVPGRIAIDFTREASSAKDAILSALADVKGAIPTAQLIEVGPDFVGLTDVAQLVGVSRQNMRKLSDLTSTEVAPLETQCHSFGLTRATKKK